VKKKLLLLTIVGAAIIVFFALDLGRFLTLENLKVNRDALHAYYSAHRAAFILTFILIYVVQTTLALPGAAILTLTAGAIFGAIMGTAWVNIGATTGAVLAFLLARTILRDWVVKKFGRQMKTLDEGLQESGLSYLLFLRFVPLVPFFLINLACGVTNLSLRTYIIGTMVGILPGSFVYANAGGEPCLHRHPGPDSEPQSPPVLRPPWDVRPGPCNLQKSEISEAGPSRRSTGRRGGGTAMSRGRSCKNTHAWMGPYRGSG